MKIRSLVVLVCLIQVSFLFASVHRLAVDTTLPGSNVGELPGIVIRRNQPMAKASVDTLTFDAARYLKTEAFRLEDLVKNIPGFRVDDNGRIYFNGKEISRIMIDGDDLAGEHYKLLSRNLKALMIDSLQLIQRHQKNRLMQTFGNRDAIAVNLVIKKSWIGKTSGNLMLSKDMGNRGEGDAELIRLTKKSKQLCFINTNNTGANGVTDRGNEMQGNDRGVYRVWPFDPLYAGTGPNLPPAYVNINNDKSLAFISSLVLSSHTKLSLTTTAMQNENRRLASSKSSYNIPGTEKLNLNTSTKQVAQSTIGNLRMQLETDKGGNKLSSFQLNVSNGQMHSIQHTDRNGILTTVSNANDRLHQFNLHATHHVSWKLSPQVLLQLDTRMAIDRNRNQLQASFSSDGLMQFFVDQAFSHHGKMAGTDLSLIRQRGQQNARVGIRAVIESITSAIGTQAISLQLAKYYPYLTVVQRHSKKISTTFDAAAGTAMANNNAFIFHLEEKLLWQRKPTQQYRMGIALAQKPAAIRSWHAGPVFFEGTMRNGIANPAIPLSVDLEIGATKMDLYKGFVLSVNARAGMLRNDYGLATAVGNWVDSLSWFIIPLQRNLMFNARVEQFIHALKLKYILEANGMLSQRPQQLNGKFFNSTMKGHGFEHRMVSNWKAWFNGELHYGLQENSFGASGQQPSTMKRIVYGISTTLRCSSYLFAHLQYCVQRFERGQSFDMLDGVIKAVLSPRWRCSIALNNLMNHQCIELLNASPYGNDRFTQQLNGRQVLFGLNWGF
ncbi:MAG: hypothetical protein ACK5GP_00135 [bacterium]